MQQWQDAGYFAPDLPIKRFIDSDYATLTEYIEFYGGDPFLRPPVSFHKAVALQQQQQHMMAMMQQQQQQHHHPLTNFFDTAFAQSSSHGGMAMRGFHYGDASRGGSLGVPLEQQQHYDGGFGGNDFGAQGGFDALEQQQQQQQDADGYYGEQDQGFEPESDAFDQYTGADLHEQQGHAEDEDEDGEEDALESAEKHGRPDDHGRLPAFVDDEPRAAIKSSSKKSDAAAVAESVDEEHVARGTEILNALLGVSSSHDLASTSAAASVAATSPARPASKPASPKYQPQRPVSPRVSQRTSPQISRQASPTIPPAAAASSATKSVAPWVAHTQASGASASAVPKKSLSEVQREQAELAKKAQLSASKSERQVKGKTYRRKKKENTEFT